MNFINSSYTSPESNLACDEVLLNLCEDGKIGETLRIWESSTYFVVLGSSNFTSKEVNIEVCKEHHVPILRRNSGGGTVLQGPGCISYALILPLTYSPELTTIAETNKFIMNKNAECLSRLLGKEVKLRGSTDLAIGDLKISGNSQRRRRKALLFHGTFLLDFDLSLIEKLTLHPSKEPEYRKKRSHLDFVMNTHLEKEKLISALKTSWNANTDFSEEISDQIEELNKTKYKLDSWNYKFN